MRALPLEYRVVAVQAVLVATAVLAAGLLGADARWALAGGGCVLIPNLWMARRTRGSAVPGQETTSAAGLFVAMFVKLAMTVVLVAAVLARGREVDGPAFFAGMIAALIGHHASFLLTAGADEDAGAKARARQADRE